MIICAVKHLLSSLLYSRPCANARSIEVGKVLHLVSTGMQIPVHNQDPLYCIYKISLLGLARAGQARHLKAGLDGTLCFHCRGPRFDPWSGTRKPCGSGKKKKKEDWMAGNIVNSCHGVLLPRLQMCEDPMQLLPLGSPYNQSQASAPLGTILKRLLSQPK